MKWLLRYHQQTRNASFVKVKHIVPERTAQLAMPFVLSVRKRAIFPSVTKVNANTTFSSSELQLFAITSAPTCVSYAAITHLFADTNCQ